VNKASLELMSIQACAAQPWPDDRFPPSRYYRFLRLLAQAVQPSLSVELGVGGGGASFHMAIGWLHGTVVGVENAEPDDHMRANWEYTERYCPNWVLWRGDSVDSAPGIAERHGPVSILFVDTIHTFERTAMELVAWGPFLASGCVACFDDLERKEMDGFWDWLTWPKVRLDHLHENPRVENSGGFGVAWRL